MQKNHFAWGEVMHEVVFLCKVVFLHARACCSPIWLTLGKWGHAFMLFVCNLSFELWTRLPYDLNIHVFNYLDSHLSSKYYFCKWVPIRLGKIKVWQQQKNLNLSYWEMGQLKTMSLVTTAVFYFAEKWLITDWSWDSDFFFVLHYSKGEVTYWSCVCLYIWIIQGNYFPCWC